MTYPHGTMQWIGAATTVSTAASVICNMLPNADLLENYPRIQGFYKTAINFIAALAINIRHCLPSLNVPAPMIGITKPETPEIPKS